MSHEIRVVVVDDSPTIRRYLTTLIDEAEDMRVVGKAYDGTDALAQVQALQPDVISMDIKMPGIDGLEATRQIMTRYPTPVVVVSGLLQQDVQLSLQALEAGALAVIAKPPHRNSPSFAAKHRELLTTLRAMSAVKVVSRRMYSTLSLADTQPALAVKVAPEIIAIASSTGGPSALTRLLRELPANFPVPIVIAQHMPDEFMDGLARWLDGATALRVRLARDGLPLIAGSVVLALGSSHLRVERQHGQLIARLTPDDGRSRYHPCADIMMESIAETCGADAIGVVLTGMGDDGTAGLSAMKQAGAVTIAQDEASSIVFGMPRAAIEREAVTHIEPLLNIPLKIQKLL